MMGILTHIRKTNFCELNTAASGGEFRDGEQQSGKQRLSAVVEECKITVYGVASAPKQVSIGNQATSEFRYDNQMHR